MGRHGGGSRSGGGGGSHGGGSRGGGSAKTSAKPFAGCYNRGYYHKGVYHSCYTNSEKYGTSRGRLIGQLLTILFMCGLMLPLWSASRILPLRPCWRSSGRVWRGRTCATHWSMPSAA